MDLKHLEIFRISRRMDRQDDEWNDYVRGETMNLELDGGLFDLSVEVPA